MGVESGLMLNKLKGHTGSVLSVELGSIATLVFASVTRHSLRESQGLRERQGSSSTCSFGEATPSERVLATHEDKVAFSSDNLKIVSGSEDESIRIWDTESGLLLRELNGHSDNIWSIAFSYPINDIIDNKLIEFIKSHIH